MKIISLGAGVQSSTMLLMSELGELERVDGAIFADTQAEPKVVYAWLDWLETQVSIPIYRVSAGNLTADILRMRRSKTGDLYWMARLPFYTQKKDGSKGILWRKCTSDYKIRPIIKKLRQLNHGKRRTGIEPYVESWIGISIDEIARMKPSREEWIRHRWPLIELGMTRNDCRAWMAEHGFPEPPRSACIYCPFHSSREWRNLSKDEFQEAVKFEREAQRLAELDPGNIGKPFLHKSLVPLDEVDFRSLEDKGQLNLFINECEGMCGV